MNHKTRIITSQQAISTYIATSLLYSFGDKIHGSNFTIFLHSRGLSFTQVGIIIGLIGIMAAVTDFPTGILADKYGRKNAVSLGLFLYGFGLLTFLVYPIAFWSFLGALFIGLGISFCSGSLYAWIKGFLDQSALLEKTIILSEGLRWLGATLAGLCAFYLLSIQGKYTFLIGGLLLISTSIMFYIFVPENYGDYTKGIGKFMKESYQEITTNKRLAMLFVSNLLADVGLFTFIVGWQPLWVKAGNSHKSLAFVFIFLTLFAAFGSITMTKLRKKSEKTILLVALGIQSTALLMIPFSSNIYTLLMSFLVFEFAIGIRGTCIYNMYVKLIPSSKTASCLSLLSTLSGGMRFIAATTAGVFIEKAQFLVAFSIPATLSVIGGIILFWRYLPVNSQVSIAYEK